MDINILNENFERIAVVDYYKSLMWCKRYYDIGALDIEVEATEETLELFRNGNYVTRNDDDAVYRIEAIELRTDIEEGDYLIVGAYDCKKILNQRIIWNTINFNGTVENYLRTLITDNIIAPSNEQRKIENFALKPVHGYSDTISQQATYTNLGDKVIDVCKSYGFGWKITLEDGIFYFDLYRGKIENIVFSPSYDNLSNSTYKVDSSSFVNVALVGGEGEGKDRKLKSVGTATGLERKEVFVDAKNQSTNEEITEEEYYQSLAEQGKEKLAENNVVSSFEGAVNWEDIYTYKTDYDLGDAVIVENRYKVSIRARIVEIIETWDTEGYTLEPKFDYNVVDDDYILTEKEAIIMTEDYRDLIIESKEE